MRIGIRTFGIRGMISLLVFLFSCASSGPPKPETKPVPASSREGSAGGRSYIDAHSHVAGQFGPGAVPQAPDYDGAARVALEFMDRLGIKEMLIMPPPFSLQHPRQYDIDELIGIVRRYPDRFGCLGGGGTLNVIIQEAVKEGKTSPELRQRFEKKALEILSKGAVGFGEMTAEHLSLGRATIINRLLRITPCFCCSRILPQNTTCPSISIWRPFLKKCHFRLASGRLPTRTH